MSEMMQTEELATEDHILTYARHMAKTAQCNSAKLLFELFAQQATQRLKAKNGLRVSAAGQEIGGNLAPSSSIGKGDPARSTRSGSKTKIKGSDACSKAGAVKCGKCGMAKGSPGCCVVAVAK